MEKTLEMHLADLRIEIASNIERLLGCEDAAAIARGNNG